MQGRVVATLWVALILWLVRVAAIYGGSWLGSWLGGTPPEYRLRIWQGMITQVQHADRHTNPLADLLIMHCPPNRVCMLMSPMSCMSLPAPQDQCTTRRLTRCVILWQAGVAMGLAKAVAVRFPDWGPDFVFLMVRPSHAPATLHLQSAVHPVCSSWTTPTCCTTLICPCLRRCQSL